MKKTISLFTALCAVVVFMGGMAQAGQSITGTWKNIDDETGKAKAHIKIFESNGKYYAKIIKLLDKPQDTKCDKCKGSRHNKPVVGMLIVWNLKKKNGKYEGGTILDPNNGKTYRCYIEPVSANKLKVRGFIGFSLLGRTQYWYRI